MHRSQVVFSLLAVAWLVAGCGSKETVAYETTPAERGHIVAKVTATGTLSALVTVQVGAQVSGRIQKLNVDFNSRVKQGQVLAVIDPALFQAAVEQAKANLIAAQGVLAKSEADSRMADVTFTRNQQLAQRNLVAPADLDTARANAEGARATVQANQGEVAQAKANLHQAETNLSYTIIPSPIDGVVISRAVDVGQTVASALQAPTLFTIAKDLTAMQVDTSVSEADVGKLSPGMSANFRVDAYPDQFFRGKIRQIRNAPQTVQNVVTYDAVIDVANPEEKLRPGMTANVTFIYASRDDVLRAPNTALRFRPPPSALPKEDGGAAGAKGAGNRGPGGRAANHEPTDERTLWVLKNNIPTAVKVHVGITDGSTTEIVSGDLNENDLVITELKGGAATSGGPGGLPFGGPPRGPPPGGGGGFRRMF